MIKNIRLKICIAFLLLLKFQKSIQQDVCIFPEKNFTENINQMAMFYVQMCEKSFCQGKLSYKCGSNHCATNMRKCFNFFKASQINKDPFMEKFKKIRTWNATGICLNGKGCLLKKVVPMRVRINHMITREITCPCKGRFKKACDEKYCALSEAHCKEFNSKLNNLGEKFNAAKCLNDNQIIRLS